MVAHVRSVYLGFALGVVSTLLLHTFLDYNFCMQKHHSAAPLPLNVTRERTLTDIVQCKDSVRKKSVKQRGDFVVFENYIVSERSFKCGESVTLTAPGDYRFLDNVVPLVERWRGPVSVALYAPGYDFFTTLHSIAYLRICATPLVRDLVTFHLFFELDHMPKKKGASLVNVYRDTFDCSLKPPYEILKDSDMYKESHNLSYPINVARNVARLTAQTHFVFPSDIELYPTRHFVPKFMNLIERRPELAEGNATNVFVVPIFEVLAGEKVPENKTQLQVMVEGAKAILFHKKICAPCHRFPMQDVWFNTTDGGELDVFHVGKRTGKQAIWEPFFVCTNNEPLWDERLNWEGQGNKMCQAYSLCLLNYDFVVLDNAFLIHKPGVKKKKVQVLKHRTEVKRNNEVLRRIQEEMQVIYGENKECKIHNVFKKGQ